MKKKISKRATPALSVSAFPNPDPHLALAVQLTSAPTTFEMACEALGFDMEAARAQLLPSDDFRKALQGIENEALAYAIAKKIALVDRAAQCLEQAMLDPYNREAVRAAYQIVGRPRKKPSVTPGDE